MNLLPSIASSNIADLLSKSLPAPTHHRYTQLVIGDDPTTASTSVATATVVACPTVADTAVSVSNSVPTLLIVLDAGASFALTPFASDFALEVTQAPCGLFRSASASVVSSFKVSTPVDPYTLITGEDAVDLLSTDLSIDSDSVFGSFDSDYFESATAFEVLESYEFGTATLVFILDPHSGLQSILVEPTQIDWLHWVPLPRLTPTESYYHIFMRVKAFAFTRTSSPLRGELLLGYNGRYD